jgi:hypothetical protein
MNIVAVWLIVFFLQNCGMQCMPVIRFCVTHTVGVCLYFLVSRPGLVALSVYRASHVCGDACNSSCLVLQFESAETEKGDEQYLNIAGRLYHWREDYCEWVQSVQIPVLSREVWAPSLLEQHSRYVPHRDHAEYNSLREHNRFMKHCFEL